MYKSSLRHKHSNYDLHDDLEKIKSALAEAANDVKGRASEILMDSLDEAKLKKDEIEGQVSDYIAERPIKSLGISMLIGFAIGYFIAK